MQLQCVSANSERTPEVHGEMDLRNYMLLQYVRLVGAVGIENNADRNFKDVEEMPGSAKELKRNNRECKERLFGSLVGKVVARWFTDRRCPLASLAQPQRRSSGRVVPATNQNSGPCTPVAATLLTDWGKGILIEPKAD